MATGPLAGMRVMEFSQIVAGPFLGCVLSDLGAEVVKVERPGGDFHRNWGAIVPGEGKRFQSLNRGKRSIVIDLRHEGARDVIRRLVTEFDVVTNNFRPRVSRELGIDYESLREVHPSLVYASITGWGSGGPMAELGANDPVISAYSGLTVADQKVDARGAPRSVTCTVIADFTAGLAAAVGIASALLYRERTGEGQHIEAPLLQSALAVQPTNVMREPLHDSAIRDPMMERVREVRARGGDYTEVLSAREGARISDSAALRGFVYAYATRDGYLQLGAITPPTRDAVRRLVGITDDRSDEPDYDASDPANIAYADTRIERLRTYFADRTSLDAVDELTAAGVPVGPVQLPEELADDRQVQAAGMMADLEHPVTGAQRVVGPIIAMSGTPTGVQGPAPTIGADTDELLGGAGFDASTIASLREAGVVA